MVNLFALIKNMFLLRMMLNAETIFIACTYMYVYMEAVRLTDVHFSVYNKRIYGIMFSAPVAMAMLYLHSMYIKHDC